MLKKVLIANRGEIAHRIQCACQSLGVSSVCVASEADREAYFARAAQELVIIGPAPAGQSYLDAERLIAAALETSCDSVHPGYGFLSELSLIHI